MGVNFSLDMDNKGGTRHRGLLAKLVSTTLAPNRDRNSRYSNTSLANKICIFFKRVITSQ